MNLKAMAEHIRDTTYADLGQFFADAISFDRALVMDMMQTPCYRPYKNELFVALREITEWQRGTDRGWDGFMQVDSAISRIVESVRCHDADRRAERAGVR